MTEQNTNTSLNDITNNSKENYFNIEEIDKKSLANFDLMTVLKVAGLVFLALSVIMGVYLAKRIQEIRKGAQEPAATLIPTPTSYLASGSEPASCYLRFTVASPTLTPTLTPTTTPAPILPPPTDIPTPMPVCSDPVPVNLNLKTEDGDNEIRLSWSVPLISDLSCPVELLDENGSWVSLEGRQGIIERDIDAACVATDEEFVFRTKNVTKGLSCAECQLANGDNCCLTETRKNVCVGCLPVPEDSIIVEPIDPLDYSQGTKITWQDNSTCEQAFHIYYCDSAGACADDVDIATPSYTGTGLVAYNDAGHEYQEGLRAKISCYKPCGGEVDLTPTPTPGPQITCNLLAVFVYKNDNWQQSSLTDLKKGQKVRFVAQGSSNRDPADINGAYFWIYLNNNLYLQGKGEPWGSLGYYYEINQISQVGDYSVKAQICSLTAGNCAGIPF